jgi:hypothetical protein
MLVSRLRLSLNRRSVRQPRFDSLAARSERQRESKAKAIASVGSHGNIVNGRITTPLRRDAMAAFHSSFSMDGKRVANGKLAPRNALRAQDGVSALTALERVGQRAAIRWPVDRR